MTTSPFAVTGGQAGESVLPTPGQTVGPFFGYALPYAGGEYDRRCTLIAEADGPELRFDVRLQGDRETVFVQHSGHESPGRRR
jgi:hypothetical protein